MTRPEPLPQSVIAKIAQDYGYLPAEIEGLVGTKLSAEKLIGKRKAYRPPFHVVECPYIQKINIADGNNSVLLTIDEMDNTPVVSLIAQYICDLLNREHYDGYSEINRPTRFSLRRLSRCN